MASRLETPHDRLSNPSGRLRWLVPLVLAAAVLIVFIRTVCFDFTNYDEKRQLLENPYVRHLGAAGLIDIFTHFSTKSYYPIRLLSFAMDYRVWGLNPAGYHLTNVLIHLANVLLLFSLGLRLSAGPGADAGGSGSRGGRGRIIAVGAGTAVFALHPLVVEPVAWVSGREELLMGLFTLACVHFHLSARPGSIVSRRGDRSESAGSVGRGRRLGFHGLAGLSCAGACLSNAVAAIVPAIIAACDATVAGRRSLRRIAAGTWFLFGIGAATVVLKQWGEKTARAQGEMTSPFDLTVWSRALTVADTYWHNISQLLWPKELCLLYPRHVPTGVLEPGVLAGAGLAALTLLVIWRVRHQRIALFGLLWFVLALAPSSQVIPHHVVRADRFLYLPLAGLSLAVAPGLLELARRGVRSTVCVGVTVLVLGVLAVRSAFQVPVWRNSFTLFGHCLQVNPNEPVAYLNRGAAYITTGDLDCAREDLDKAIALFTDPTLKAGAYNNRGEVYARKGDYDRAIADYDKAIDLHSESAETCDNRGKAHEQKGDYDRAIADFTMVIRLTPDDAKGYYNRGVAHGRKDEYDAAIADFTEAIHLKPDDADAYNNRGVVYGKKGDYDLAIADFTRAIDLFMEASHRAGAYRNRGRHYDLKGERDRAIADFEHSIALDPDSPEVHENLARLFAEQGRGAEAVVHCREALRLRPGWPSMANNLAWILATDKDPHIRHAAEAVQLAEQSCQAAGYADPQRLDTLAAAYAEAGRFEEAVATARKALAMATAAREHALAAEIDARLKLYTAGRPYRVGQ